MVFGCLPKKPIFEKKKLHIFCGPHFYKKWRWIELGWCGGFRFHSLNQQKKREFSQAVLLHTWLGHLGYSFLTGGPHGLPYMWFFALQKKATLAKKICLRRGRCHHDIIWNFISVTSDMWSSKELWICASGNGPRNVTVNAESPKMCVCVCQFLSRISHEDAMNSGSGIYIPRLECIVWRNIVLDFLEAVWTASAWSNLLWQWQK